VIVAGIPGAEEYLASPSTGNVQVSGSSPSPVLITYTTNYLLVMSATPTTNTLVFPGITYEVSGANVTITAVSESPNLTFSGWTGICVLPALPYICTGSYTGSNNPAYITMGGVILEAATFVNRTFNATFNEKGLPANTSWSATVNGTTTGSKTSQIQFSEPSGTYNYTVNQADAGYGARYNPDMPSGRIVVDLDNVTVNETFTPEFLLNVGVASTGGGTVAPVGGWLYGGSVVTLSATPDPGYVFLGWQGVGAGNYSGTGNPVKLGVKAPINETAMFGELYNVTFVENGLPANTTWPLMFNGVNTNVTSTNITLQALEGVHTFTVGLVPGYMPSIHGGKILVNGTALTVVINFTLVEYTIQINETGLPSGASWSVIIDGARITSTTTTISVAEPNGTYSYTVAKVSGYAAKPSSGSIVLAGISAPVLVIKFTAVAPTPQVFGVNGTGGFVVFILVLAIPLVIAAVMIALIAFPRSKKPVAATEEDESKSEEESKSGDESKEPEEPAVEPEATEPEAKEEPGGEELDT
jgi:hypothetical protein